MKFKEIDTYTGYFTSDNEPSGLKMQHTIHFQS
jgi:hypothetical protein